jgi:hypothetical protein
METLKKLLLVMAAGFVVGFAVACLVVPGALGWYNTPGMGQAMCNCAELVQTTASSLIKGQLIGGGVGALLALVAGILVMRRQRSKAAAKAPPPAPPAAAPTPADAPPVAPAG